MLSKTLPSLKSITNAETRFLFGNRSLSIGGLATGTTKSKVKTVATITFMVGGLLYSKAATDDCFVHTDVTVQPVGTTRYYLLCLDATGAASILQGDSNSVPPCGDTLTPVGVLKIVTDATHTFTPGTTLNDAAGITATYAEFGVCPLVLP